jgi:hypothetical protein
MFLLCKHSQVTESLGTTSDQDLHYLHQMRSIFWVSVLIYRYHDELTHLLTASDLG